MSSPRPWLTYSLLRIGLFAAVFAVLALSGVNTILAAVIAAVFGLCVTYIFFRPQRDRVAASFYQWRTSGRQDRDGDAEDEALDRSDVAAERHPSSEDAPYLSADASYLSEDAPYADDVPSGKNRTAPSEGERDR